ncbi:hypothetical protein [Priestia megaterium]|uniref:hypothetical protein n=1 Tax=Priestia megaterium TaxID=1404 RepID=UPI001DD4C6D8|nr:hypothetical protein [Priestia megaterium]CAH0303837.1 hypothetical protein SRABI82_04650 [Priestia megaterium]
MTILAWYALVLTVAAVLSAIGNSKSPASVRLISTILYAPMLAFVIMYLLQ